MFQSRLLRWSGKLWMIPNFVIRLYILPTFTRAADWAVLYIWRVCCCPRVARDEFVTCGLLYRRETEASITQTARDSSWGVKDAFHIGSGVLFISHVKRHFTCKLRALFQQTSASLVRQLFHFDEHKKRLYNSFHIHIGLRGCT